MIVGIPLNGVNFVVPLEDLTIPLDLITRFSFYKPETEFFITDLIPNIQIINNTVIFQFCLTTLLLQDLPNALLFLPDCGEYIIKIETSPDGITWTEIWIDLFRLICTDIIYNYPI